MKKLIFIFLIPLIFFLVSCGGGEGDLQPIDPQNPSLEETTKLRKKREWFWINQLKTYHPFGMNTQVRLGN